MTVPVIEPRKRLTRNQRTKMHDAHGSTCVVCLLPIPKGERFIDEHVIPLELGGTNDPGNRGPAHIGCAKIKTQRDQKLIAKAKRIRANHIGVKKRKGRGFACGRDSMWKKKVDGSVVRR